MVTFFEINGAQMAMDTCAACGTQHSFELSIYNVALQRAGEVNIYCPYGHKWHYKPRKQIDEEAETRRERDQLRQRIAQKDDEIAEANRRVSAAEGQVTRLRNRANAGLCPCCNRHFDNLQRHMATKHKDATP